MSKYVEYVGYTELGCLVTILFDRSGNIMAAMYADKSLPINLNVTEQLQVLQKTPSIQRTFLENKMIQQIQNWFLEAEKKQSENDFDKEPA